MRVEVPVITIQPQEIRERAKQLSKVQITLQLITPLRLIDREHTVREAKFRPLVQRLLERYLALERYYGDPEMTMTREGKLEPFLDLLVLGKLIHVGKNVVKGDGWYKIV